MFSIIPPPYKQYAQAAGIALIVIAAGSFVAYEKHKSTVAERDKWVAASQKHAMEVQTKLIDMTTKAKEESERSAALAQQIEAINNANKIEINDLHNKLVNPGRVQSTALCRGNSNRTKKQNNSAGVVIAEAADTATLSEEFTRFLISDALRADGVGIYADEAYSFIQELCKDKDRFICD